MFYSLLACRSSWIVQQLWRSRLVMSSLRLVALFITLFGLILAVVTDLFDISLFCFLVIHSPSHTPVSYGAVCFIQALVFARSYWEQSAYCEAPGRGKPPSCGLTHMSSS